MVMVMVMLMLVLIVRRVDTALMRFLPDSF
jgi:hypothetical protein